VVGDKTYVLYLFSQVVLLFLQYGAGQIIGTVAAFSSLSLSKSTSKSVFESTSTFQK